MKDLVHANQTVEGAKEHSNHGIVFKSDAIDWKALRDAIGWKACISVTVSDSS